MRDYTFHHQVAETYDFTRALQVSINEFAPDNIVLLGPGNSLGGATGQTLAAMGWRGINDKDSFTREQEQDAPQSSALAWVTFQRPTGSGFTVRLANAALV